MLSPITAETFKNLQFDAGILLYNFDYLSATDAASLAQLVKSEAVQKASWLGGSFLHPIQQMTVYVTDPETQEKQEYPCYLFVKDFGVYDLWFDSSLISSEAISEFEPIVEAK